jgi:asparagine synthase (glutamine-hydrolysing)
VNAEVVRFALSLPVNLKIESADDKLRKRVLRQAAKNLGIPASIADRPKKAVQFATGVDEALERLARKEGLTRRSYVDKVFRKVYPSLEGRNE